MQMTRECEDRDIQRIPRLPGNHANMDFDIRLNVGNGPTCAGTNGHNF